MCEAKPCALVFWIHHGFWISGRVALVPRISGGDNIMKWKHDPIYVCLFEEIGALWADLDRSTRPTLLRVEEHEPKTSWNGPTLDGRTMSIWIYDDFGARLAPILRREDHNFGGTRDDFYVYGLVKFAIESGRDGALLEFRLGPEIRGEIRYDIEEDGGEVRLLAQSQTFS
jgi:hypothetical protein